MNLRSARNYGRGPGVGAATVAGLAVLAALVAPAVLPAFSLGLLAMWLPYGLLAVAVDVLWGENRIVSFGHGVFFALGGYLAGLILRGPVSDVSNSNLALLNGGVQHASTAERVISMLSQARLLGVPWLALLVAVVVCAALGALIGVVIFRLGEPELYAPLITLGVGVIATAVFLRMSPLGGSNGLSGIPTYLPGATSRDTYLFNLAFVVVVVAAYGVFRRSRPGLRWRAVGDDPVRLEALGTHTTALRTTGFACSAGLAGLAGALFAGTSGFISADLAGVTFSVQALVWVAVGGSGRLFGPLIGVLLVQTGQQVLSEQLAQYWPLALGAALLTVVLIAPRGVTSFLDRTTARTARAASRKAANR